MPSKRETCEWAFRPEHYKTYPSLEGRSTCRYPVPASFPAFNRDWLIVDDGHCDHCPCWKQKGTPTVEAQCAFCGESKPFPAALMPIQPKPRVCAECTEKETTDAE